MHKLCTNWANQHASKFDSSKYQLVHLLQKRNMDINKDLILDNGYLVKVQISGILLGVEIDNQLKLEPYKNRINMRVSKNITTLFYLAESI